MPIVQAAIVRAGSLLGDTPGIFALLAVVQTSAPWFYPRLGCSSIQGVYGAQANPAGELTAVRSMQPKPNVSFCNNSAWRKSGQGLLIAGLLGGMR
jgi:hypothetical protein